MSESSTERRVVVVTGGNRGIGLEVVRRCAARGDTAVLGCRDLDAGRRVAAGLTGQVMPVAMDVTDVDGRLVAEGAASVLWAADLPDSGPTSTFTRDGRPIPW